MLEIRKHWLRGLYAVTPDGLPDDVLLERVEATLRGGASLVQYRDKQRATSECEDTARSLCRLCRRYDAGFVINDDLALALKVDADGVHLGADDGDLAAARRALGPGKMLGASCYADLELARHAVTAGVDYVAFGAVYPSSTKPDTTRAPLELFAQCRAELRIPTCAIGGITLDNAPALLSAGADLLAVISDLFTAPDIESRARAYHALFAGD